MGLQVNWDKYQADYTCSHEILGQTFTSKLDHFFWSPLLRNSVTECGVLHLPGNLSDHCPIYCNLDSLVAQESQPSQGNQKVKPRWHKASLEENANYKYTLDEKLSL